MDKINSKKSKEMTAIQRIAFNKKAYKKRIEAMMNYRRKRRDRRVKRKKGYKKGKIWNNSEAAKAYRAGQSEEYRIKLYDSYVRAVLKQVDGFTDNTLKKYPDLIDLKRTIIKIKRIKNGKSKTKNNSDQSIHA